MIFLIFALFSISLITCILFDFSILFALTFGFILFFSYGLIKGFSFYNMILFSYEGIKQIKGMLLIFVLIGMMTAIWRAAGTIPMIIELSTSFLKPSIFIPCCIPYKLFCFRAYRVGLWNRCNGWGHLYDDWKCHGRKPLISRWCHSFRYLLWRSMLTDVHKCVTL